MHALGEQRERPGQVLTGGNPARLHPETTAEFRKLAKQTSQPVDSKTRSSLGGWPIWQPSCIIAIDAGERHRFACRLGISNRATGKLVQGSHW